MVDNIIVKRTFNKYTADLFYKNFRFTCKIGFSGILKKTIEARIDEIFECTHGVRDETVSMVQEDPKFLTLVVGSPLINPRTICLKFPEREERNSVLSGLRWMISDVHMNQVDLNSASYSKENSAVLSAVASATAI